VIIKQLYGGLLAYPMKKYQLETSSNRRNFGLKESNFYVRIFTGSS